MAPDLVTGSHFLKL